MLFTFQAIWDFPVIHISSNIFQAQYLFSYSSETPVTWMIDLLLYSYMSPNLCSPFFFFQSIFSVVQVGKFLLFHLKFTDFFHLSSPFCCLAHSTSFKILVIVIFTIKFLLESCFYYFFAETFYFLFLSRIFVIAVEAFSWRLFLNPCQTILILVSSSCWQAVDCLSSLKLGSPLFLAIFCQNFYIWGIVHETVAII